jgi:hypothetical protein
MNSLQGKMMMRNEREQSYLELEDALTPKPATIEK